jgi:hypothetical protein
MSTAAITSGGCRLDEEDFLPQRARRTNAGYVLIFLRVLCALCGKAYLLPNFKLIERV